MCWFRDRGFDEKVSGGTSIHDLAADPGQRLLYVRSP